MIKLIKINGIDLKAHWSFFVLIPILFFVSFYFNLSINTLLRLMLYISLVFGFVILHEFGHSIMARKYEVNTKDIILTPIGGIARLESLPNNPVHEFLIALAGPLVNLFLAATLFVGLYIFDKTDFLQRDKLFIELVNTPLGLLYLAGITNVFLFLFNLLPAYPMDGGRMLKALLSLKYDKFKATMFASMVGRFLALSIIIYGINYRMTSFIILGLFIYVMTTKEYQVSKLQMQKATDQNLSSEL